MDSSIFFDDDLHDIDFQLSSPSQASLPVNNIYYDDKANAFFGLPIHSDEHYFVLSASDGFQSISISFYIKVI